MRDGAPVAITPEQETANADVGGELQIGFTIADHGGSGATPVFGGEIGAQQADSGFARVQAVAGEAAVYQHFTKADTLRAQYLQQQVLRAIEMLLREARGTEAVLVGNHDEFVAV